MWYYDGGGVGVVLWWRWSGCGIMMEVEWVWYYDGGGVGVVL